MKKLVEGERLKAGKGIRRKWEKGNRRMGKNWWMGVGKNHPISSARTYSYDMCVLFNTILN